MSQHGCFTETEKTLVVVGWRPQKNVKGMGRQKSILVLGGEGTPANVDG
jgi:hypothetical protein